VLGVTSYGDLSQFAQQQSRASAFILSIDDEEFTPGPELDPVVLNLRNFIQEVRRKNLDVPIYVYGETKTSRHMPNDILRELHGFIHMFEDTPEFVARHIIREAKSYLEGHAAAVLQGAAGLRRRRLLFLALPRPFRWRGVPEERRWGRCSTSSTARTCCAPTCATRWRSWASCWTTTVPSARASATPRASSTPTTAFFVTNGTSTSNKMVWHHTVAPGDVVVVDRNCHKSNLHAIIMTGAIPVFLKPTRNHFGIIGPDPAERIRARGHQGQDPRQPAAGKGVDADKPSSRA
jgi:arginine decarboxylase